MRKLGQVNTRNVFTEKIQNPKPKLHPANQPQKLSLRKKMIKKLYIKQASRKARFAPNTILNYRIPLDGKALLPGVYVATFEADEGNITGS